MLAFNLALFAALVSPGPAMLISVRTTLTQGRAAGIAVGLGLGTMAAVWTALALLGLDSVFRVFPWAYAIMKIGGAAYLIWIAYATWKGAHVPLTEAAPAARGRAFRTGFLVNLGNPKSVLFAAAVLVVVFPQGLSFGEVILNHLSIELIAYTSFAWLMARPAVSRGYLRAKPVLDRITASVLGALGLRIALTFDR